MRPAALLLLLLPIQILIPQGVASPYSAMFYNVENLFHPSDDPFTADEDFTPEGERRWSFYRYNRKVTQISKVILAVNGWETPDLIILCELENELVLQDIISHPLLMKHEYNYLHRDGPDQRGIDVAILYRRDRLKCIDTTWLNTKEKDGRYMKTREILTAKFVAGKDTILCAANHWTSRYGGAMETESKRIMQARTLGNHVDSSIRAQPGLLVIAGGDFNDESRDVSVQLLLNEYNMEEVLTPENEFTYKYQGKWASIDHVFVSGGLTTGRCRASVPKIPFLVERDEKQTGTMPFRTYRGFAYNGGISDHLPLLLVFVSG